MSSAPVTILAFDTSSAHCAAALLIGGEIARVKIDEMARGQAEHLFPMLERLLADEEIKWSGLSAIGVGIGAAIGIVIGTVAGRRSNDDAS